MTFRVQRFELDDWDTPRVGDIVVADKDGGPPPPPGSPGEVIGEVKTVFRSGGVEIMLRNEQGGAWYRARGEFAVLGRKL